MSVYELDLSGRSGGEYVQNVLHYDVAESGSSFGPYDYAQDLFAAWNSTMRAKWLDINTGDYELTSERSRKVQSPGGPMAVNVESPGTRIGSRGALGASGIGPVILFPVNLAGRNATGKIFVPGVANDDILDNVFVNGLPAKLLTFSSNLVIPLTLVTTGVNAQFCIYHRKTQVNTHAAVNRISEKVGTQRKRYVPMP